MTQVTIKEIRGDVVQLITLTTTHDFAQGVIDGINTFQLVPFGRRYWMSGKVTDEYGRKTHYRCEITFEEQNL